MTLQRRNTLSATKGIYNSFAQPRSSYTDFLLTRPPEPGPPIHDIFTIKDGNFIVKDGAFMTVNECCCNGGIGDICPTVCDSGTSQTNAYEVTFNISDLADYMDMYDWSAWSHPDHNPNDTPGNLHWVNPVLPPEGWFDGKAFNSWKISPAQITELNGIYLTRGGYSLRTSEGAEICGWDFTPWPQYNFIGVNFYLIRPSLSNPILFSQGALGQQIFRRQGWFNPESGSPVERVYVPPFANNNQVWAVLLMNIQGRYSYDPRSQPSSCWIYYYNLVYPYNFIYSPTLIWAKLIEDDIESNGLPDCRTVFPLTFSRADAELHSDNSSKYETFYRDGFVGPFIFEYLPKVVPNFLDATITIDAGI